MTAGRRVRVCLVTGEYPPDEGGVGDYTWRLAEALAAQRAQIDVLTVKRPTPASEQRSQDAAGGEEAAPAVSGEAAPGERRQGPLDAGPESRLTGETPEHLRGWVVVHRVVRGWGWGGLSAMRRALTVLRPDVVHVQYQAAAYGLGAPIHLAPRRLRAAERSIALTYHDLRVPYLFPKAGRLRDWAVLAMGRWSDAVVATNEADYWTLVRKMPRERVSLIPIGSNVPDAPPPEYDRARFRRTAGFGPDAAVIAYFGMLTESKGAGTLVSALDRLVGVGRDARLVMVGSSLGSSDPTIAASLAAVEAQISRLSLGSRVRWTGHLPPSGVSAWLKAADVVALPYRDGASYRRGSLLAALEHGMPVVTTSPPSASPPAAGHQPWAPPALEDGVNACLVPPDDPGALAQAVASVLDDRELAARLGRGARQLARAFEWPALAARHLELYESLRSGAGR